MDWKNQLESVANLSLTEYAGQVSVLDWAKVILRMKAIESGTTVISQKQTGAVEQEQLKDFLQATEKLKSKYHLVETTQSCVDKWTKNGKQLTDRHHFNSVFLGENLCISVDFDSKESKILVEGFDKDAIEETIKLFSPLLKRKSERQGRACALLMDQSIYVSDLGPAGEPLVRENYSPQVVEDYDFLVKDLSSENPRGRLAILDGPPGTGKSYFVRGLINDIQNSIFLIVPSSLVSHLSEPSFMPAIIDLHEEEGVPIVLVLEDADTALLPRDVQNMSTISDLLNFADGIVGKIIDFRIIATTNAKKIEIEKALLRKGRLSRHVHIGILPKEQATSIFKRLTGLPILPEGIDFKEMTLADVYDLASEYTSKGEENE